MLLLNSYSLLIKEYCCSSPQPQVSRKVGTKVGMNSAVKELVNLAFTPDVGEAVLAAYTM